MVVGRNEPSTMVHYVWRTPYQILLFCMLTKKRETELSGVWFCLTFRDSFPLISWTFFSRTSYSTLHTSQVLAPISAWSSLFPNTCPWMLRDYSSHYYLQLCLSPSCGISFPLIQKPFLISSWFPPNAQTVLALPHSTFSHSGRHTHTLKILC